MTETANFKCLRCGHQYTGPYDPETEPQERMCPKCRSNSVRRLRQAQSRRAGEQLNRRKVEQKKS